MLIFLPQPYRMLRHWHGISPTQPTMAQTNNAILLLEMFGQYTIASNGIIDGFSA